MQEDAELGAVVPLRERALVERVPRGLVALPYALLHLLRLLRARCTRVLAGLSIGIAALVANQSLSASVSASQAGLEAQITCSLRGGTIVDGEDCNY